MVKPSPLQLIEELHAENLRLRDSIGVLAAVRDIGVISIDVMNVLGGQRAILCYALGDEQEAFRAIAEMLHRIGAKLPEGEDPEPLGTARKEEK